MDSQRILLTGGAGFIGSHLAEALLHRKAKLTIVDSLDDFYSQDWKRANLDEVHRAGPYEFDAVDICDIDSLRETMTRFRPEIVIHLAARAGVRPSIEQPRLYEQVNVSGTVNLLELCRDLGVKKFVFGSSSSVYGATSKVPFSEGRMDGRPISPYAATKLSGELLCYTYAHLFRIPIVCLRFFTAYGPRQRPDLAIRKFVAQMEAGKPVPVFGDGTTGRDYTHVDDMVAGILGALDYQFGSSTDVPFDVFNLGNSHPVTLADLLLLLERVTGKKAIREQKPPQPGDVPLTWADISKSSRLLNYHPKVPLEEGLKAFVSWYRSAGAHQHP
jgi:UDP-glucuronate 4-epimerase